MENSAGRVALVTGASRGIGRAIALDLAARGLLVVVHYKRNDEAAKATLKEIENGGGHGCAISADLESAEEVRALLAKVKADFGRVEVLVLNAAASAFKPMLDANPNNISRTFAITLTSSLLLVQGAVDLMAEGGRIVAVSGWDTLRVIPRHGVLAGAKAALETWVKYFACELGARGINVNTVCPGPIEDTLYPRVYGGDEAGYQAWRNKRIAATPRGRLGTPQDVARVVGFLSSTDAEWITGQTIVCDGGLSLTHLTEP